jgi:hypothetical protein
LSAPIALAAMIASPAVHAGEQAIDGCIDQLPKVGGPDARSGGTVLSTEFSKAGTLVMLRDGGGTVWRCIGYSDGAVSELRVVDDASGAEVCGITNRSRCRIARRQSRR